ncbi:hypothetical protein DK389_07745 [Methylobacterium durans]|uniref:Uncharacterized protein n=1 Tax=Methylobacterium durans TaxID=2202825 RepID=A0A2U8W2X3_9HYPH|nr:hypothetical protein DK389_07745 [Methylobacterium durans]
MARPVTYSILDCPRGLFEIVAVLGPSSVYRRGGFQTLAEAEASVEELRALMAACGATLLRCEGELSGAELRVTHKPRPPPWAGSPE